MDDALRRLPCGYVSFGDDGTILSINDTLLALLGIERGDVEGQRLDVILDPGSRVFYHTHLFPMLKLHRKAEEIYIVLRGSGGRAIPVLAFAARNEDANDCVFIEVTRREKYQDELARARELFIGILGHDLRVPLTSVTLGAETLLRLEKLSPEGQETAAAMLTSARRAARMTTDLLDFARIRFTGGIPIQRQPMDLCSVAEKVIGELRTIHPGVDIGLRVEGDCRGTWDSDRAAQVVANLIGNAVSHGREGSPVTVALEGGDEAVVLEVRNAIEPGASSLGDEVFAVFRQGEHSLGLGLGLFIVREVLKAHGGTVTAAETDGEFRVRASWPRA